MKKVFHVHTSSIRLGALVGAGSLGSEMNSSQMWSMRDERRMDKRHFFIGWVSIIAVLTTYPISLTTHQP
jgi:hypothetical protein